MIAWMSAGRPAASGLVPVVVPGAVDYSDDAHEAFARFAEAGAHVVRSTDPVATWPGPLAEIVLAGT